MHLRSEVVLEFLVTTYVGRTMPAEEAGGEPQFTILSEDESETSNVDDMEEEGVG